MKQVHICKIDVYINISWQSSNKIFGNTQTHRQREVHEVAVVNLQVMLEPLECKVNKFDCHDQVSDLMLHEHDNVILHEQDLLQKDGQGKECEREKECERDKV